jgi:predicted ATP-grasp superfamily ATP-dependent carboligase
MTRATSKSAGPVSKTGPGALILGGAHGSLAVARSLGRQGIPVWVLTTDHPITRFSTYATRSLHWLGPKDPSAADFLLDLAQQHHLQGWVLFASGDAEVAFVAQHHAVLSSAFRLTTPAWDVTQFACDKHLTYQRAESVGVSHPRSYRLRDRAEVAALDCLFPVILKPSKFVTVNAFTRAKAWKAETREELLARYDTAAALVGHDAIVIQEFIPGSGERQFSYAAVWSKGKPVAALVARRTRQYPIDFGFTSTFVEVVDNKDVEAAAVRFLGSLNYEGLVELEFKFDNRESVYKLLDFNARPWTWLGLGGAAGVDFPHLMWQVATGATPKSCSLQTGATWMFVSRDVISAIQNIVRGRLTLWGYMSSFHLPMALAAFTLDDPIPGLVDLPLTFARTLIRRLPLKAKAPPQAAPKQEHDGAASLRLPAS